MSTLLDLQGAGRRQGEAKTNLLYRSDRVEANIGEKISNLAQSRPLVISFLWRHSNIPSSFHKTLLKVGRYYH